jgi:hypothetical protein
MLGQFAKNKYWQLTTSRHSSSVPSAVSYGDSRLLFAWFEILCRSRDDRRHDARRRVASFRSYGAPRLHGVQKHKIPLVKFPAKSTNYLCKCTAPSVTHFAPLVLVAKSTQNSVQKYSLEIIFFSCIHFGLGWDVQNHHLLNNQYFQLLPHFNGALHFGMLPQLQPGSDAQWFGNLTSALSV